MDKIIILCRSLGRHCGIAQYSNLLAERLGALTVSSAAEVPNDADVVFVQYEPLLYEGSADVIDELQSIKPSIITVLDAHNIYPNEATVLPWHTIVATKRGSYPGTLRLSLCLPSVTPVEDAPPAAIRLGAFGFAFPGKRYESIIELARRLGVPATILAAHNDATLELSEISSSYLAQLGSLAGGEIEVIDEFLSEEEIIQRLRRCSHLISAMDDNFAQSASMRAMACVGRPIVSLKTKQADEVGAILVDDLDSITLEFLGGCNQLPHVYDGFADYKALLDRLDQVRNLMAEIEHPDAIYLDGPRQMERLIWLRENIEGKAIDVGIGSGFATNFIRAKEGVEIRADRLAYASLRYPHIDFRLLDARSHALSGFDTVVFGEIVEHMPLGEASQMLALWAATNPKRMLITTPNAAKLDYDEDLVHNPEHLWEPTEELVQALVPVSYRSNVTTSSQGDFLLLDMQKSVASRKARQTKERQIEALLEASDELRRLAEEREVYAVALRRSERALQDRVNDLDRRLAEQNRRLAEREQNQAASEEQITLLQAEKNNISDELQAVLGSKTWRITAPLRKMASGLRAPLSVRSEPRSVESQARVESPPSPETDHSAACTIISKNYLAQARVLADSFKRHHPDIPFYVLLADRLDGYFDPHSERFNLVDIDELEIPDPDRFRFRYTVIEHDTAVKPYLFSYLLERVGIKKLIYFDPDILILHDLSTLFALLDAHPIVLTPHITAPIEDQFEPNEITILKAGIYNLGFIGLASTPITHSFLRWWQKRLYDKCLEAPEDGLHVDQRWVDLAPGMFDGIHILKHPGCNVAYWNLQNRAVDIKGDQVFVNGEPCYFFHFSGFNPDDMRPVSKHQNRFTFDKLGLDVQRLFKRYSELLLSAGYRQAIEWPYAFATFDNAVKIPKLARTLYRQLGDSVKRFGNPFETTSPKGFFNWLNERCDGQRDPSLIITRLWYEIYQRRPDVQRAYSDVFGTHRRAFLQWVSNSGPAEHDIDDRFVVHQPGGPRRSLVRRLIRLPKRLLVGAFYLLKPLLKTTLKPTIGRNERVWRILQRARDRLIVGSPLSAGIEASFVRRLYGLLGTPNNQSQHNNGLPRPFGVNVAGYLTSEKGTGEAARSAISILDAADIPVALNNIIDSGSENIETDYLDFAHANPYAFNLVYVNADQAANFAWHKGEAYFRGHYNIGAWNWELTDFPKEWLPRFQYYNEIWVATKFVLEALSQISPVPVVRIPYALHPEPLRDPHVHRSQFGVSNNQFFFLFMFDFHSVLERKNPLGLIEAFKRAFPAQDDVTLVIKSSHADQRTVDAMCQAAKGASIKILDTVLTRDEIIAVYSLCDCYISLHRSEGFGLTLAEAMLAGKPTIGTAYGGNVDFMTLENSYLVNYALTEIDRDYAPYQKGWHWADPDLDHAAVLMRHVYENPEEARAIGRKAREDVIRQLHPQVVGDLIKQRLLTIASYREIAVPNVEGFAGQSSARRF